MGMNMKRQLISRTKKNREKVAYIVQIKIIARLCNI